MTESITIKTPDDASLQALQKWLAPLLDGETEYVLTLTRVGKVKTPKQRNSLHKWCELTAEGLNAAGLDRRKVLKPSVAIPWDKDSVKDDIWRPIMTAMTGHESTEDMSTIDPTKILEVITRHLAEKHGFQAPEWPSQESMMWGQREAMRA